MSMVHPWRAVPGGFELVVRLTPRGGRSGAEGIALIDGQPVLRLRVAAPPVEGAANDALIAFLAKALRIPRTDILIVAGERSRIKRLRLFGDGVEAGLLALLSSVETDNPFP